MNKRAWLNIASTDTNRIRYWFRAPMGLEKLLKEEITGLLPIADALHTHRNVFIQLEEGTRSDHTQLAQKVRLADDVYSYWGSCRGIDRSKDSVQQIIPFLSKVLKNALADCGTANRIRPTVSFVGKRNFNRFFVEEIIRRQILEHTQLAVLNNENKEGKVDGELRLRCHIENDMAYFGLGLRDTPMHRRAWRNLRYTGQLHTPVAAAMARALTPPRGSQIVDPFCGSGTILIESAIISPGCIHEGWDISEEALDIARQSAKQAATKAIFKMKNSLQSEAQKENYYLLSNPPWDEKHQVSDGEMNVFIAGLVDLLRKSTAAVLLLPEALVVLLEHKLGMACERIATTRIRGKLAVIVRYDERPNYNLT